MILYSEYAGQADWIELLEEFVNELPQRIQAIEAALASDDLDSLKTIVHQLRGACGSYGFHSLSEMATHLELNLLRNSNTTQRHAHTAEFVVALAAATTEVDPHIAYHFSRDQNAVSSHSDIDSIHR